MNEDFYFQKICRMCNSGNLDDCLSLNPLPIGDRYIPEDQKDEVTQTYPMDIRLCETCGHLQNSGYINPELIYKFYLSRPATTNPVLSAAYKEYADYLLENFKASEAPFSVETGSNDGAFSKYLQDLGVRTLGIEPSPNLSQQANEFGVKTLQNYFSFDLARQIKREHGEADYFIANHMFANVIDSSDFARGVKHLLGPGGVFVMQTFYQVDVLQKKLLENFTHEHLSYFNIRPYKHFLELNGMELIDVQRISAKAGSIRCFAQHAGGPHAVKSSVQELVQLEEQLGMDKAETYGEISGFINQIKTELHALLGPAVSEGKTIAGFGTSIGATTFVFQYDLGNVLSFFVDDDTYRHNLVSPVYHIPVLPTKTIYDRKPDYVIVLAPLYADIIMKNNKDYLEQGGKFVLIWPEFKVIDSL